MSTDVALTSPAALSIVPEERAVSPKITGTPVEIAGKTWLFAQYQTELTERWDRVYDNNIIDREYQTIDIYLCAAELLLENYLLELHEAVGIVFSVRAQALVPAVEFALFGPRPQHRTWSMFVESSLWGAGHDPNDVPPRLRKLIVDCLEESGLTPPVHKFVSSQEAAYKQSRNA